MEINVAMSSDNYYAPFASVCMASILENTNEIINFYVLSDGISRLNKEQIKSTCEELFTNGRVTFIDIDGGKEYGSFVELAHISRAMYGKFYLPELLPDIDRLIYTDVDAIFTSDIKVLWEENLDDYVVGAVPSQRGKINDDYKVYKLTHGLRKDHAVMMSGLLLIDCVKWRKEKICASLVRIAKARQLPDQEAMNIVFDGNNYKQLSPKYCVIYKILEECYSHDYARKLKNEQIIIHYPGGGSSKPWYNPALPSAEYFWESAKKTNFDEFLKTKYGILDESTLVDHLKQYEKIIIYGAGHVGRTVLDRLTARKYGLRNICFAVTNSSMNPASVLNTDVYGIEELLPFRETAAVIIAVDVKDTRAIDKSLAEKGFVNIFAVNGALRKELENNSSRIMDSLNGLWNAVQELQQKMETIHVLLDCAVDIRNIPTAKGSIRILQLCDILLLKIFHKVCAKHRLTYWLDYGTLLGTVRHRDFIPWDDDLDVAMPREDYDKAAGVMERELDQFGIAINTGKGFGFQVLRILYKDTAVQLDVWPYDHQNIKMPDAKAFLSEKLLLCNKVFYSKYNVQAMSIGKEKFPRKEFDNLRKSVLGNNATVTESNFFFSGAEAFPYGRAFIFDRTIIFPLKKMKFGEDEFYVPNHAIDYLSTIYGNIYKFPRSRVAAHFNIRNNMNHSYEKVFEELSEIFQSIDRMDRMS